MIEGKSRAEIARILGLGKKIEEFPKNPMDIAKKIKELASVPMSMDEVEEIFKKMDEEKLLEEERKKREAKIKALEKSIEDLRGKIEEYRRKAEKLRTAAQIIFQNLHKIESMLEEARARGEKKLKVDLSKLSCDSEK